MYSHIYFIFSAHTNLVALAGRPAWFAGVGPGRGVGDEASVRRALGALAAQGVDVVAGGARHARRARGLRAEGAGAARGRHAVHGVADRDGEDPSHVVDPLPRLGRGESQIQQVDATESSLSSPSQQHSSLSSATLA